MIQYFCQMVLRKPFAEMNQNEKGSISHRGQIFVKKLVEFLDSI